MGKIVAPPAAGATPALVLTTANAAGTAETFIRTNDDLAIFDTTAPTTSALGDAAAVGAGAVAARRAHVHGRESFGTPALVLSTTNGAGTATTPIRSDGQIALFDATVPVTQASADAAATGSAGIAARRDHRHGMPTLAAGGTPAPVLATTNAAGVATSFLRTDDQLAVFDATVPVTQASADAAATGSAAIAARRDHRHGMPTITSGALVREGGQTTEATTTSTTAVDLLTASSLTLAALEPGYFTYSARKTSGAATRAATGLKINATAVANPSASDTNRVGWLSGAADRAESGGMFGWFSPRLASYLDAPWHVLDASYGGTDLGAGPGNGPNYQTLTAAFPNAEVTSLIVVGISTTSVTLAADELQVYSLAAS